MKLRQLLDGGRFRFGAATGRDGGPNGSGRKGIRVPLPILFFLLMTLVVMAVFDILSQSQKVHQLANRRIAKVLLDSTLKDVRMNLNGYAARLALQGGELNLDLNKLFLESTSGTSPRLSQRTLILYLDEAGQLKNGFLGSERLAEPAISEVLVQIENPRALFPDANDDVTPLHLITANQVDYVISDSSAISGGHGADAASHIMIGLPIDELLINKLRNYEIFSIGSLGRFQQQGRLEGIESIAQFVAELQNEEYKAFHLDAVAQVFIVLIAFVICVMIGQHIDEKNTALEDSHADISEREKEAQRLRNLAEKASEAKSRFIANMSHELRTPLNAVLGCSELIMNETFGKLDGAHRQYKEHAENIHAGGTRLHNQISQILDFSALELGEVDLNRQSVALEKILADVSNNYADRISARNLRLELVIDPNLPRILADRDKIADLLRHVVSNAVKFCNVGGTVRIGARVNEDKSVEIRVKDSGIGIDPDQIDAIRQPFVQGQDTYARSHQGIGLGLTLAKAYADMHGATLSIESERGAGTQVIITFPPGLAIGAERLTEDASRPPYGDPSLATSG